jgi:hypothetical protein
MDSFSHAHRKPSQINLVNAHRASAWPNSIAVGENFPKSLILGPQIPITIKLFAKLDRTGPYTTDEFALA